MSTRITFQVKSSGVICNDSFLQKDLQDLQNQIDNLNELKTKKNSKKKNYIADIFCSVKRVITQPKGWALLC
jgi:nicotinate-nucleotide pyrophosphorylase